MSTPTLTPRLTVAETAHILGRSERWVRQAALAKDLPAEKVGGLWRFNPDDLELYLLARQNRPPMTMTALSAQRQANKH